MTDERRAPIPLAAPDGTVYAYACGWCRKVRVAGERMVDHDDALVAASAESSEADAERCCTCSRCGAHSEHRLFDREPPWGWCLKCWTAFGKAEQEAATAQYHAQADAWSKAFDESLALAADKEAALSLRSEMEDASEDRYCAGWESGIEFILWDECFRLELAKLAGGWFVYDRFVPHDEWVRMFDDWTRAR